jgi:capsular exopolysaccharide synthesis family protein
MSGSLVPSTPSSLDLAPDGEANLPQNWGPPAPPATPAPGAINIGRYVAALKRYKWLIVGIVLLGSVGGFVATRFIKPTYQVDTTIVVGESPDPKGPVRSPVVLNEQAWGELLKSFAILDPVARQMGMYVTPNTDGDSLLFRDFQPTSDLQTGEYSLTINRAAKKYDLSVKRGRAKAVVESGALGDSVGRSVGFVWLPSAEQLATREEVKFTVRTPREAANDLRNRLSVYLPPESRFIKLGLRGQRSRELAQTMNAVLREFVSEAAALKKRNLTDQRVALGEQLEQSASNLQGLERQLKDFQVNNALKPTRQLTVQPGVGITDNPGILSFLDLRVKAEVARRNREAVEALATTAPNTAITPEQLLGIPGVLAGSPNLNNAVNELTKAEADLRTLTAKWTDSHPLVIAKRAEVERMKTQTIPAITRQTLDQLKSEETELDRRINAASSDMRQIPATAIEEGRLIRERDQAANLNADIQGRWNLAKLAEASAIPDVSVLDSAVAPSQPTSNTAPMLLLLVIGASLGFAVVLAIVLDLLDKRFRYPEQATNELGLDILGTIPSIRRGKNGATRMEDEAQLVEAFRGLRLNVRNAANGSGPVTLAISSPGPGDGKSLISSNLALAFAEAGYRTLLIDGDIRRGQLHSTFSVPQRPGLVDHLTGDVAVEDVIRETSHGNLFLIPCGTRRHRGPELLAADSTIKVIRSLRSRFDAIIVDTAPLGAGIDPYALGAAAGTMLLVLRTGQTDRKLAQAKLTTLDRLPVRLIGAVLNDIQAEGMYKYYSYLDGYGTLDEDDEPRLVQAGGGGSSLPARRGGS